jgi:hypothetical protein
VVYVNADVTLHLGHVCLLLPFNRWSRLPAEGVLSDATRRYARSRHNPSKTRLATVKDHLEFNLHRFRFAAVRPTVHPRARLQSSRKAG